MCRRFKCPQGNKCCGPCAKRPACIDGCHGFDCADPDLRDRELARRYGDEGDDLSPFFEGT